MQFIDCVNRILRLNGLIRGDTDILSTFSDTAHNSSSSLAQIAIQDEISELSAKGLLPYQRTYGATLTMVANQRTYSLPSNFIQIWGEQPYFYDAVAIFQVPQYPGNEARLRTDILTYQIDLGYPLWWYWVEGTTQKVGFYPTPDTQRNGLVLTYDYECSVNVANSTDTIPIVTTDQQYAFTMMASRRFKFIYEGKIDVPVDTDPVYREARARLFALMKGKQPSKRYGNAYVSGQDLISF